MRRQFIIAEPLERDECLACFFGFGKGDAKLLNLAVRNLWFR